MPQVSANLLTIIWTRYNIRVKPIRRCRRDNTYIVRCLEDSGHIKANDEQIANTNELKKV